MILYELALIPIIFTTASLVAPLLYLITRNRYAYAGLQVIASAIALALSIRILATILEKDAVVTYPLGGWPPPIGITYVADVVNATYGLIACTLALLTSVYSFWYYKLIEGYQWLSSLIMLLFAGITGCIYTGDLFNFFVMLEVLTISSYILVAFFKRRKWALEASVSYAFIGAMATTFFLLGVAFIYLSYGTLNMADVAAKAHNISTIMDRWSGLCRDSECYGNIALASAMATAFMLWALTFEAGIFPNNYWLPSAYTEAPTPASAVFAGIVDKIGTYGILRLFLTIFSPYGSILTFKLFGVQFRDLILHVLGILGLITGFLGAIIMAIQKDVKRLLSYSTISHIGLMFIAMAGLTSNSSQHVLALTLSGILFHSITHALGESMLFIGLGTLATIVNSRRIDSMYGYGKAYPLLSTSIAIGALSLLGIAPLGGFFSKYILFLALSSAGLIAHAISIVAISGIAAIGYFKLIYALFIQRPLGGLKRESTSIATGVCLAMTVLLIALGVLCVHGWLYTMLYESSLKVSEPIGIKQYIAAVENTARALGG